MKRIPVWIDCDTGLDDAAALLVANRMENLEILGLSTVSGNVALEKTTRNTLKICDLMGADYPVHPGAARPWLREYRDASLFHGADGLGGAALPEPSRKPEAEAAWDAIYRAALARPGELALIVTGPLTNAATAIAKYPRLRVLLSRILIMGGAAVGGNCTPCAEYNIYTDPDAAQAVFRSGIPIVLCPLDVTEKAFVTPEDMAEIAKKDSAVTHFFCGATRKAMQLNLRYSGGLCLHDVCPVLYLAHPELFSGEEAGVYVETRGALTLGKTVTDLYSDHQFEKKNAFVVLDVDRKCFVQTVLDALWAY